MHWKKIDESHSHKDRFLLPPPPGKEQNKIKVVYHEWVEKFPPRAPGQWGFSVPKLFHDNQKTRPLSQEEFVRSVRFRCVYKEEKPDKGVKRHKNPYIVRVYSFMDHLGKVKDSILVCALGRPMPQHLHEKFLVYLSKSKLKERVKDAIRRQEDRDLYAHLMCLASTPAEMPKNRTQLQQMADRAKKELEATRDVVGAHGQPLGKKKSNESEAALATMNWLVESSDFAKFTFRYTRERLRFDDPATDYWIVGCPGMFELMGYLAASGGLEVR